MQHYSPSRAALGTSGLLIKICDYLETSDHCRILLRVSRPFLLGVSTTLWRNISGLSKVLQLIHSVRITQKKRWDGMMKWNVVVSVRSSNKK
jgi:hypothetical protein